MFRVYGILINVVMFALMVIGYVQERTELMVAGLLFGIVGLFAILIMGRVEFGNWKWWG